MPHSETTRMPSYEVEATLAICSNEPDQVASEIAEMNSLGEYLATPVSTLNIRDVYFDLPDAGLRSQGLGLRIRTEDGCRIITLKGPSEAVSGGGLRRSEIEEKWSVANLDTMLEHIRGYGLDVPTTRVTAADSNPLDIMHELGFLVDHTRSTTRRLVNVTTGEKTGSLVAELVVDSVIYHFSAGDILHHEVEIEIKGIGEVADMQDIVTVLRSRWPAALRPWHHGKRSTGRAIEALLEEGSLSGLLVDGRVLMPAAYDILEAHLR